VRIIISAFKPTEVERLILEWKVTHGIWPDKRGSIFAEEKDQLSLESRKLLYKAGSAKYKPFYGKENGEPASRIRMWARSPLRRN
jgi:hypothetical protein